MPPAHGHTDLSVPCGMKTKGDTRKLGSWLWLSADCHDDSDHMQGEPGREQMRQATAPLTLHQPKRTSTLYAGQAAAGMCCMCACVSLSPPARP